MNIFLPLPLHNFLGAILLWKWRQLFTQRAGKEKEKQGCRIQVPQARTEQKISSTYFSSSLLYFPALPSIVPFNIFAAVSSLEMSTLDRYLHRVKCFNVWTYENMRNYSTKSYYILYFFLRNQNRKVQGTS